MKQNAPLSFLGYLCVVFVVFAVIGCNPKSKTDGGQFMLDSINESGEVPIRVGVDTPSITITINYAVPNANDNLIRSFNTIFFGDSLYASYSPQQAAKLYIERRGAQYRGEYSNTNTDGLNADLFNRNVDLSDSIIYADSMLVSVMVRTYVEDGLTPSTTDIRYYNLLRNSGSILVEADIFVEDYKEPLTKLIVDKLVQTFGVQKSEDLENLGFFNLEDLQPNGNFYLNDKGVTYRFDRIDMVASESDTKLITLPYDLIANYIKPDSPLKAYLH